MTIPLDQGFTVVTGPNGSGKSNILDGVLFCLGLANSKGMRADRLPDLVNSGVLRAGKSAETIVSVRFDLTDWEPDPAEEGLEPPSDGPWIKSDQQEWTITRRLKVMPGGSYSSSYSSDGDVCNLQQLQTQLRRLRIDPEGSNVVMQGDVTRIVSMSNKDRRGLIDELAGVALFDNRIEQSRKKLEDVQGRQDRCRIVQQELLVAKQRLEKDCEKARVYKDLKKQLLLGREYESVLAFEAAKDSLHELSKRSQELAEKEITDQKSLSKKKENLDQAEGQLTKLQNNVKALGEDKLLKVQAELAGLDTQSRELERQASHHKEEGERLQEVREKLINRRREIDQGKSITTNSKDPNKSNIEAAEKNCRDAEAAVELTRRRLGEIAGLSGVWLEDQRKRSADRQKIREKLMPLQNEHQKLQERILQDGNRQKELQSEQERDNIENQQVHTQLNELEKEWEILLQRTANQKEHFLEITEALGTQRRTKVRLENEQASLEKEIAKLESRRETLQESRGTGALKILLEAGLEGIHGSVAELGEVQENHRLALEVAAGARLNQIVVDDDRIASKAIELIKSRRAGRLTFLPINKIKPPSTSSVKALEKGSFQNHSGNEFGLISRAVDLVRFEPVYSNVFAYVFGETLVFHDLTSARNFLGKSRAVTLDGELLEKSGAMTGGSFYAKSNRITFGRIHEKDETEPLKNRLLALGEILSNCTKEEAKLNDELEDLKPDLRKLEQRQAGLEAERSVARRSNKPLIERTGKRAEKINLLQKNQLRYQEDILKLNEVIDSLLSNIKSLEKEDNLINGNQNSDNWEKLKSDLENADQVLESSRAVRDGLINKQQQNELSIERLEDQNKALLAEEKTLQNSVGNLTLAHKKWKEQQNNLLKRKHSLGQENQSLQARLGEERRERDEAESKVSIQRQKIQEDQWNLERLKQDREGLAEELRSSRIRLKELEQALPKPLPEIPENVFNNGLELLQAEIQKIQQRMEALEPVNMLALEELAQLEERLGDLIQKLDVLNQERTELLLRIENVATLRQEAFMEAFDAVDIHFREIFASLSEGDGHLQLDNPEAPLEGGLTLVAHPKGKTVRRLAAMSGGEKSLTALSFLFALQRFKPSPFYALDEVDSFLDGVNVERLSALIAKQAQEAQFLVVSHRRPMIGASSRTIGVTQARGAHTQVVGLPDAA